MGREDKRKDRWRGEKGGREERKKKSEGKRWIRKKGKKEEGKKKEGKRWIRKKGKKRRGKNEGRKERKVKEVPHSTVYIIKRKWRLTLEG